MTYNRLLMQMFMTAGFAALASALVIYVTVQNQFEKALYDKAANSLESQMVFAELVAREFLEGGRLPRNGNWEEEIRASQTRVSIIAMDGEVLFDSKRSIDELDNHRNRPELLEAADSGFGRAQRYSKSLNRDLLYIAKRIDGDTGPLGFVRLSSAVRLIAEDLKAMEQQLILSIFLTLAVVFLASYLLSRRFYQPIAAATGYAREIAEGNYQLRLPGKTQDEIGVLERSLNELARKTEDRLARIVHSRNQLEAILSGLEEGVVALDAEENIAHINRAAMALLNLDEEVVGKKVWEAIRITKIQTMIEAALNDSVDVDRSLVVNERSLEVAILTMGDNLTSHEGVILVFQDVTERDRLDKIRSDFVANASHELKTPLAAIKGMIETIIDDPSMPSETARKFFDRVLSQTNRLNKIVLDLMQLSRFDSYRDQKIDRELVDLSREVRQVYSSCRVTAEEKQVTLEMVGVDEPVYVQGDTEALSQMISNLVENAIKYSPIQSEVVIRLGQDNHFVLLEVQDNGVGISATEQQRIFERFYRVDPARSRELGGTGLGLSIVKHIADIHDGSVQVASEEGRGSTFSVRLPAAG